MATTLDTEQEPPSINWAVADWLALDVRPRFIVDSSLSILWSNPAARAMFARSEEITIRDRTLAFSRTANERAFVAFVDQLGSALSSTVIEDAGNGGQLLLAGHAIDSNQGLLACLEVARHQAADHRYHDLSATFGLTGAKHRIARMLLGGQTATRIADVLGVSADTVRTHVRRLYTKIGAASREELLHRLSQFRIV